jgi:hypothetical protein
MTWRQIRAADQAAAIVIDVWRDIARDESHTRGADALDAVARAGRQLEFLLLLWRRPDGLERLRQVALDDMQVAGAPGKWTEYRRGCRWQPVA